MAVSFVIGRAGSGKTHRCFTSIVAALKERSVGPKIFWLLPRQATFSAERELTCNSQVGGFLRAQVLSFEQLGHEILRGCGGDCIPEITPLGRQMILGHLLRQHSASLKFFKNVARQPGLAAKLDATFSDFERCGKNAADLELLQREIITTGGDEQSAGLLDKVHDLHLIYNAYTNYLGQDRLDQHQRLLHVLKMIDDSTLLAGASVYVDGFTEFSEYERRVLARLAKVCRHVEITLPMDPRSAIIRQPDLLPEELSLFHAVEMTYRRLRMVFREEAVQVDEPITLLNEIHRFTSPALREMEKHAFGTAITYVQRDAEGIEMLEAPHRAAEVDAAARRIKSLLQRGLRLREIGVLVRDLGMFEDLVKVSFAEHGIRYFVDRRRQTAHHPLLQFVRAVLAIAQQPWPHEWLMTLLKTGLTGIPASEGDALENYVLAHRIRGEQWAVDEPWQFHAKQILGAEEGSAGSASVDEDDGTAAVPSTKSSLTNAIDAHRRMLVSALLPFKSAARGNGSVREIVVALFALIEQFPVRATLADWIEAAKGAGEFEQMNEHTQVWLDLVKLFDQLVELLGDERVSLTGFQEILETGLEHFDLGLTPATVDEVLVGQVDRTRTPELKAVLVLGLDEGCFPAVPHEDSVLSDSDRRELHRRRLEVAPATDRRLLNEHLLGYQAFTSASRILYLSRSLSDGAGKPLGASTFWNRIRAMFRTCVPVVLPREERDDPALIGTPRQLVTALIRWVRTNQDTDTVLPAAAAEPVQFRSTAGSAESPWPALYQWLATHPRMDDAMDRARYRAWRALSYDNTAALSPEIAARLFCSPLRTSVSEMEVFAQCPFKHFLRFGLELQARDDDQDVNAMDLGHLFHHVLEKIVSDLLKQRKTWADLGDKQKQKVVAAAVERVGHALRGEILLSTARNRYLLQRIESTLGQVISTQKTAAGRGVFKTSFSKLKFGEGGSLPAFPVETPKHREVRLSGKIDRVDLHEDGHGVSAIDYRLGARTLRLDEVYHGLSLQLLTYLLVLEANGQALVGHKLTPAAAFYVRMLRWMGDVDHPGEALSPEDPAFHLAAKPRGLLDEQFVKAMDAALESGPSEVVHARINKNGAFGAKSSSDLANAEELAAVLGHVRTRIGELADGILDGEIGIAPYMLGQTTPCPSCEYRGVCRFDARVYHILPPMARQDVLQLLTNRDPGDGGAP